MVEVMFEILLFSAYLSAALISVVIAVYAIAVSYLGRETSRSIWLLKKRQIELKDRIKKFGEKMDVGEMEKEIKRYRQEEATLRGKLRFLSINGAVLLPLLALSIALFFSLVGIRQYQWPSNVSSYIVATLAANVTGIGFLLKVLKTVEWAALRVPMPKFEVFFISWLKEETMMIKEKKGLQIRIANIGDMMAESLEIFVFFQSDFKVTPKIPYSVVPQTERDAYPHHNATIFKWDKLHINVNAPTPEIIVEAPEKSGKYKVPIWIYEKNSGQSVHELFLEVVD